MNKKVLRKSLLEIRAKQNEQVHRDLHFRLLNFLNNTNVACIGAYWAIKNEFNPLPALILWQKMKSDERKIALPRINQINQAREMVFYEWQEGYKLMPDVCNIPAPYGTPQLLPELLLIACVGFSADRKRLGYGGGFYDRWLSENAGIETLGLAFEQTKISEDVFEPHDVNLSKILTQDDLYT